LLAGKPNASTFPFTSLSFKARSPTHPGEESTLTIDGTELEEGLQYGDTAGLKSLLDWIQGLQELNHGRQKDEGWRISIGSGSQDLIYKVNFLSKLVILHYYLNPFSVSGGQCHG
jgi:tryptophan aminotransferase